MIVKNEEQVLSRCLDSLAGLMDEIIIVDTGSCDRTREIAARYTDKIYDYIWKDDFADARNFAFSKASMEYIYTADADEVLDDENREQFRLLKEAMVPEVEIVQMKYVTKNEFNTVLNFKEEYRPKLYLRLRTFTWIDPIHETVRLDPLSLTVILLLRIFRSPCTAAVISKASYWHLTGTDGFPKNCTDGMPKSSS